MIEKEAPHMPKADGSSVDTVAITSGSLNDPLL